MTYQEAANYLRISLATIDRMVRAGEISSVLIRGRLLFRIRDLDDNIPLPLTFSAPNEAVDAATTLTATQRMRPEHSARVRAAPEALFKLVEQGIEPYQMRAAFSMPGSLS